MELGAPHDALPRASTHGAWAPTAAAVPLGARSATMNMAPMNTTHHDGYAMPALAARTAPVIASASIAALSYRAAMLFLLIFAAYLTYHVIRNGPTNPFGTAAATAISATREAVRAPAVGLVAAEDLAVETVDSALSTLERAIDGSHDTGDSALDHALAGRTGGSSPVPHSPRPTTRAPGYCYVGEDRGFRACAYVADPGNCMSGEVFEREDICKNPTLRA